MPAPGKQRIRARSSGVLTMIEQRRRAPPTICVDLIDRQIRWRESGARPDRLLSDEQGHLGTHRGSPRRLLLNISTISILPGSARGVWRDLKQPRERAPRPHQVLERVMVEGGEK